VREELGRFNGAIRFMDEAVGRILAGLAAAGLDDDTLVMFTTDHGMAFPRAKGMLYDAGLETALMIRMPAGEGRSGVVAEELVSSVDIVPTLLEAVGLAIPEAVQGGSFLGVLTGGEHRRRERVFAEKNYHDCYDPIRCVRTARHKYIRNYEVRRKIVLASDMKRSAASQEMWPWAEEARPEEELYDLSADPHEMENLAGRREAESVRAELARRLEEWMVETEDPLLRGPVAAPAGARVDEVDPVEGGG
jgi:arylsulfatase A-like enzyme